MFESILSREEHFHNRPRFDFHQITIDQGKRNPATDATGELTDLKSVPLDSLDQVQICVSVGSTREDIPFFTPAATHSRTPSA
ncbi:hypothetical protein [Gimesia sp.]|uniref:hypothetical protein n=1 Tax=Gimesia sp. TaxID=2024833 RepID=UPI0025C3F37F|nr:hypothetical protein [Gimesia sp.]